MTPDLFRFFEDDVAAQDRIVLAELQALCRVSLVLFGVVDVAAFGALQLDVDAIIFFRHDSFPLLSRNNTAETLYLPALLLAFLLSFPQVVDQVKTGRMDPFLKRTENISHISPLDQYKILFLPVLRHLTCDATSRDSSISV